MSWISLFIQPGPQQRRRFIDDYVWPAGLERRFAQKHPQLDSGACALVFDALRQYFRLCLAAERKMISMPSQVVDDAWHEFLLYTRDYSEFCQGALGRFLHHTPAEAMKTPTSAQEGIRRAWQMACRDEHINARRPNRLPLIFAIDGTLNIPNGFRYDLNCLAFQRTKGDTSYCATHIGCGGSSDSGNDGTDGCSDGGSDGGGDGGGSSCGGGCGGGD